MAESALTTEQKPSTMLASSSWLRRLILPCVGFVLFVLLWEGVKALFALPHYKLPHLWSIAQAFARPTPKGPVLLVLLGNIYYTGLEALTGFVLGGVLGFGLAALFVFSRTAQRGCLPWAVASQTVPIIAVAPMIVVGVGAMGAPTLLSIAIISAYLTFFPVTINTLRGLTSVDPDALALMRSYAASPWQIFVKLRLPASVPYLFTALRISATASVVGAIIGELPSSLQRGIGAQIVIGAQTNTFNPGFLWATIIMAGLLGMIFYGAVVLVERWVVRWQ